MGLIRNALRHPIAVLVLVAGIFFFGLNTIRNIKVDIFPALDLPVIYISQPYGGYTPEQMEGFFAKQYVNILLFVSGIKSIETKNIQGLTLIKLTFYEGTNMAQAAAEVTSLTTRTQALFPPGSQPPFIIRFDASTLPVGQLVLNSPTRSTNELLDLANVYIRSSFSSIPGLVSAPPFGGNIRTIVIKADPQLLRSHNLTPDQVVSAITGSNQTSPSGNVRIGNFNYISTANTIIRTAKEFGDIPLYKGGVGNLYLRDIATIEDAADITSGYALVNGKRSVYISVAKTADASTWDVVQNLKKALPRFQNLLPEDVKLSFEFDQSQYVINSVKSLLSEGGIGAILTGLMVLFFLGDLRGALIVILTIPTCIISGVLFLSLFGQTINIMTLSGLALAIGILVDESTVTIENIHQHLDKGKPKALAIADACKEIAFPKLLILFCILAVFAPALTMSGIPGSLFMPLSLAIGFSMITSYLLSQSFVPIMANWLMKGHPSAGSAHGVATVPEGKETRFERFKKRFIRFLDKCLKRRKMIVSVYVILAVGLAAWLFLTIGRDVLPKTNAGQFQVRLRAPEGTRIERTEERLLRAMHILERMVGKENISITSAYVGQHPGQFSISPIYLFMAGPQEAVLQVNLHEGHEVDMDELKEEFRREVKRKMPDVKLSFEPIEMTEKVLSQGASTPVEIRIAGKNKERNVEFAKKVMDKLNKISYLRDVQIAQSISYPSVDINLDRIRAAQLGVDVSDVSRSLVTSTSSSRFTSRNLWVDPKTNQSYSVQVQVPEFKMSGMQDMGEIPVLEGSTRPVLSDVADLGESRTYGEIDNEGAIPYVSVTANLYKKDLGAAVSDVGKVIKSFGNLPRGLTMEQKGMSETLRDTLSNLQMGLLIAVVVIFLMLAANFQSFKVSFVVLSTVPAVLAGSLLLLTLTGATLNLQSYMGMIMSVGVSISNSVLLITNAEIIRRYTGDAIGAARQAAAVRIRPIVMTSLAMVVGMIPMAVGIGEGGDQSAPLGIAVIGGLVMSTFAALMILPLIFAAVQKNTSTISVSLDPEDKESKYYVAESEKEFEG